MLMMKTFGLVQSWRFLCRGSRLATGLAATLESNVASSTQAERLRECIVAEAD